LIVWPIVTGLLRRLRRGDRLLLLKLSRSGGPRVDTALTALSWAADHSKLWVAVAAALLVVGGPSGRRAAARGLASVALASAFVNGPLKLLSRRSRPWPPRLVNPPSTYSFPSGHTASAFAFAIAAGLQAPALLLPLAGLASAVGYSRIRARVHYPSDVVAGALVGAAAALVGSRLVRALEDRGGLASAVLAKRGRPARSNPPAFSRAVLVTSPSARRAARDLGKARRALGSAGIELVAEVPVSALADLDRQLTARHDGEPQLVVAAGGDGTVGAVADRIAGRDAVLGVIPLGTSNDFARSIAIPRDVERAVALFTTGRVSVIDLGRLMIPGQPPRHFVHAATAGVNVWFARLATRASLRRRLGRLTYVVAAAAALRDRRPFRCRLSYANHSEVLELEELAIINAPVFGGFLGLRVGGVSLTDGMLDVLAIEEGSVGRLVLAALFAVLHIRRSIEGVRPLQVHRLHVHTDQPVEVTLDGEVLGNLPADFEVAGEALRVVVPADFDDRDRSEQ
jgi:undecaprenyl-diphosphatase